MASKTVSVRRNRDRTLTVRVGRAIEHVTTEAKGKAEIFDAVKWAILSKDVPVTDVDVVELLQRAGA